MVRVNSQWGSQTGKVAADSVMNILNYVGIWLHILFVLEIIHTVFRDGYCLVYLVPVPIHYFYKGAGWNWCFFFLVCF